ncbi:MAG: DUF167 domain-containing protein [Bacillota bacterium]
MVIRNDPRGCVLSVRLQPRASKNEIAGVHSGALRIRITAPPVEGRANEALCYFLADLLEVAPVAVRVLFGRTGRRKAVLVEGLSADEVRHRLRLALTPE